MIIVVMITNIIIGIQICRFNHQDHITTVGDTLIVLIVVQLGIQNHIPHHHYHHYLGIQICRHHRYVASPENVIQLIILGITAALVLRPDQEVIILTSLSILVNPFANLKSVLSTFAFLGRLAGEKASCCPGSHLVLD